MCDLDFTRKEKQDVIFILPDLLAKCEQCVEDKPSKLKMSIISGGLIYVCFVCGHNRYDYIINTKTGKFSSQDKQDLSLTERALKVFAGLYADSEGKEIKQEDKKKIVINVEKVINQVKHKKKVQVKDEPTVIIN